MKTILISIAAGSLLAAGRIVPCDRGGQGRQAPASFDLFLRHYGTNTTKAPAGAATSNPGHSNHG